MKTIKILGMISLVIISMVVFDVCQFQDVGAGTYAIFGIAGVSMSKEFNAIYQTLVAKYPGAKISPSTLRVEKQIIAGKSDYEFRFTLDSNSDLPTERKLAINDKFRILSLGMFLIKRDSTIPYTEVLQTYPNIQVFVDSSSTFLGAHLEAFYNGYLGLRVDQDQVIEELDTLRFRKVGEVQQSSVSTKSTYLDDYGFISDIPSVTLDAQKSNVLTIKAPIVATSLVDNTTANQENFIVIIARGFRIKG